MKKTWSLIVLALTLLTACSKKDNECPAVSASAPEAEVVNLKAYLDNNNIVATADARGFFYTITKPGSAGRPTVCQTVNVAYVGKLTNGQTFDSNTSATFPLSNLILGWQLGIPLIGTGGSIVLYLPPSLAYGNRSAGSIPANSNLIFTIDLKGYN